MLSTFSLKLTHLIFNTLIPVYTDKVRCQPQSNFSIHNTYKIEICCRCWRCWPVFPTRRDTLLRLYRCRSLMKLMKEITLIYYEQKFCAEPALQCYVQKEIFLQTRNFMNKLTMDVLFLYMHACLVCLTLLTLKLGHLVET